MLAGRGTTPQEDAAMADIPKLQNERNKCYETIKVGRRGPRRCKLDPSFKGPGCKV